MALPTSMAPVTSVDGGSTAASANNSSSDNYCPPGFTVRQGGVVAVPVPFVKDVKDVTSVSASSEMTATAARDGQGNIVVNVTVHHGALLGEDDGQGNKHIVTITTAQGGPASARKVQMYVSPIVAAAQDSGGSLSGAGNIDSPFLTFDQAAQASAKGDMIWLHNQPSGAPGEGNTVDAKAVQIPDGVHVVGRDQTVALFMPILLDGDVTLDDLNIQDHRILVSKPGSEVVLHNTVVGAGITVTPSASAAAPDGAGTIFHMYGGELRNDGQSVSSLLVQAVGASVTIEGSASIDHSMAAGISFEGGSQWLTIIGTDPPPNTPNQLSTTILYGPMAPAIHLSDQTVLVIHGSAIYGRVEIADPASTAVVDMGATFSDTDGLGCIQFGGSTLNIDGANFAGLAVVQTNPASHVQLINSHITGYTQVGYRLLAGTLDAGREDEPGNDVFADAYFNAAQPSTALTPPTAVSVEIVDGSGTVVTASASSFDGLTPGACTLTYMHDLPGIISIANVGSEQVLMY